MSELGDGIAELGIGTVRTKQENVWLGGRHREDEGGAQEGKVGRQTAERREFCWGL